MAKDTRKGLTLAPNMKLELTITAKESTTYDDLARICRGIKSSGYEVKVIPDNNHPQAIVVER